MRIHFITLLRCRVVFLHSDNLSMCTEYHHLPNTWNKLYTNPSNQHGVISQTSYYYYCWWIWRSFIMQLSVFRTSLWLNIDNLTCKESVNYNVERYLQKNYTRTYNWLWIIIDCKNRCDRKYSALTPFKFLIPNRMQWS